MDNQSYSKTGSWTSQLSNILRPVPSHPLVKAYVFSNAQSVYRHPAGEIWRHILASNLYKDLRCNIYGLRRFIRLEELGLSGVLLYDIRPAALTGTASVQGDSSYGPKTKGAAPTLTLEDVFGDPDDADDLGMEMDEVLDTISGKVVYFPSYACTSFIIGQAMHAFYQNNPTLRPIPAPGGFAVAYSQHSTADTQPTTVEESHSSADTTTSLGTIYEVDEEDAFFSCSEYLCDIAGPSLLDKDDPLVSLYIRTSRVGRTRASSEDELGEDSDDPEDASSTSKDDGDTSLSTIASSSSGPVTPPLMSTAGASDSMPSTSSSDHLLHTMADDAFILDTSGNSDDFSSFLDFDAEEPAMLEKVGGAMSMETNVVDT